MLVARPLPTRNSIPALRYSRIACGEARRPSPEILEILLDMGNLDHAEPTGETTLMILVAFFKGMISSQPFLLMNAGVKTTLSGMRARV
jgi:hypothetical protein